MRCPFCLNEVTNVVDSRSPQIGTSIRRRRFCPACKRRFTTYEKVSFEMPVVIKKGGYREAFSTKKVFNSMLTALKKRDDVSLMDIDDAVSTIEQAIVLTGEREVRSSRIGELVLDALKKLDPVAYIRFASVYLDVDNPETFAEVINSVAPGKTPAGITLKDLGIPTREARDVFRNSRKNRARTKVK